SFSSLMARWASSSVAISTNPNPRARPVAMSRMMRALSTVPARLNNSVSSASPVWYGRFPTYSLRPITADSLAGAECYHLGLLGGKEWGQQTHDDFSIALRGSWCKVHGAGFEEVLGSGFGFRVRVPGSGFWVLGSGFWVRGSGFGSVSREP